jgi:hypothetical protein
LVDDTDSAILSNTTTVALGFLFTPNTAGSYSFTVNFGNPLHNPHSGHNAASGGIIASTGFYVNGETSEMFFDDDGDGNIRVYHLVAGVRTYWLSSAGTINYAKGLVSVNPIHITSASNVDNSASTAIRMTSIPDSSDIVGVRNQILEIDSLNTSVIGGQDTIAVSGSANTGYITNTTFIEPSSY